MSKHSKAKARRRRKHRKQPQTMLCDCCMMAAPADAQTLLDNVAASLNACLKNGIKIKPWHGGILKAHEGYVLPFKDGWEARTPDPRHAVRVTVPDDDDYEDD